MNEAFINITSRLGKRIIFQTRKRWVIILSVMFVSVVVFGMYNNQSVLFGFSEPQNTSAKAVARYYVNAIISGHFNRAQSVTLFNSMSEIKVWRQHAIASFSEESSIQKTGHAENLTKIPLGNEGEIVEFNISSVPGTPKMSVHCQDTKRFGWQVIAPRF